MGHIDPTVSGRDYVASAPLVLQVDNPIHD